MTLPEFLEQCLADDEAAARDCAEMFPPPWEVADRGWRVRIYSSSVPDLGMREVEGYEDAERAPVVMEVEPDRRIDDPKWLSERVRHVQFHDPARVLAEVEAKRRIIALHALTTEGKEPWARTGCQLCDHDCTTGGDLLGGGPCDTLLALAQPYADRPGWDEGWRLCPNR